MFRSNFFSAAMAVCIVSLTMIACNKEALIPDGSLKSLSGLDTENRLLTDALETESPANKKRKCFELGFPVNIITPDGRENAIADKEALRAFFTTYKAEGGEKDQLSYAYPIEITLQDGSVQLVNSQEELQAVKESCPSRGSNGRFCLALEYPVTIVYPDGTTQAAESRAALKEIKRAYKRDDANDGTKLAYAYPLNYTDDQEVIQSINSDEELAAALENCSGRSRGNGNRGN